MGGGDAFFLPPAPCLAAVPGRFGPARCSAAPHGPGKGGFPERGSTEAAGGKRERDLTAATAHFTACHALMAEEIKAGMELFIEINQSPRRRGENNIASSVIPGLRAPGRLSPKAPRELDPLGFVTGTARPCQRLAEPRLSCPRRPWGCSGGRSWLLGRDGMRGGMRRPKQHVGVDIWGRWKPHSWAVLLPPHTRVCKLKGFPVVLAQGCALQLPELPRRWWRHRQRCDRRSGRDEPLWDSSSAADPSLTLARDRAEAAKQGGIAWAGGICAGTNPAPLIRCCHLASARSASQAGRSLCYPALYPPD